MASDQVRQASKLLGPLLRRRGTSPLLGSTLRRALQALDKSLAGLPPQAQDEAVATGIASLRSCLELIQTSDRSADHEQLEGVVKALALLAPPETAPEGQPPPPLVLEPVGVEAKSPPAAVPRARGRGRAGGNTLDFETTGVLLMGLAAKVDLLDVVLSGPCFRLGDVELALTDLRRQARAVSWLGRDRAPAILRVADAAHGITDRLVAGAALVLIGDSHGGELMLRTLDKAAAARAQLPPFTETLLRSVEVDGFMDWLSQVFRQPARPAICAVLLPLLVEHGLVAANELWQLLEHGGDELVVAAARALPWTGGNHDIELLLAWAAKASTPRRAFALLFAAATLGSRQVLDRVRAHLGEGEDSEHLLVDALAVSGTAADADRLTAYAERPDADASYVLLAAAHLGSARLVEALPSFADRVPSEVLREAKRMIDGAATAADVRVALDPGVRHLHGRPWSVGGVLASLASTEENVQAQRRMQLELRVRTGQAAPTPLPTLPSPEREQALSRWVAGYAKADARLRPGGWYFQGC